MESRKRERLVGAAVLVGIVVLVVPSLLTGPGQRAETDAPPGQRSVEVRIDGEAATARLDKPVAAMLESEVPAAPPVHQPQLEAAAPASSRASTGAASTASSPPAVARAATAGGWAVQLGAFSTRAAADKLVGQLKSLGYPAFALEYRSGDKLLHRVRVGPEPDRQRADEIAARLRKAGFKPVVTPHP